MSYAANRPCGKGLIDVPIPVAILGKRFVVALFGKGFIVALLDECSLLGILNVLALGTVHNVFGVLTLLDIGDIHAFSNVLAVLNLGVFALLVVAWRGVGVIASCERQHIIFDCCVGAVHILPLHLSVIVVAPCNMTIKNDCCVVDICIVALQSNLIAGALRLCNRQCG
jgi:hypothetical protein